MTEEPALSLNEARTRLFVIVMGCVGVLLAAAIVIGVIALNNKRMIEEAEANSHHSCERSRLYAPYFYRDAKTREIMPPVMLAAYLASIPVHC
jgi:hypothetical protein